MELLQIKNFKGDFKIAKILKYPNEVRLKLILKVKKLFRNMSNGGNPDIAPFSFIMPVAWELPLVTVSFANTRKTLKNIGQTRNLCILSKFQGKI
ncbi:MAG: hypothetical protein BWK75_03590 [Candidatus Altiarchaeales archaeon A3]|nr:MAG: hypothetical protein BWK75_03590 [Candidatus Altiarchaeales archaeon A3]